jgi:hypothetical protein
MRTRIAEMKGWSRIGNGQIQVQAKEQENERQDCPHLQAVLEDGVQGGAELVQEDATSRRPVAVGRGGVLRKLVHETAHHWHSLGTSPYTPVLPWDYSTQQYSPPPLWDYATHRWQSSGASPIGTTSHNSTPLGLCKTTLALAWS